MLIDDDFDSSSCDKKRRNNKTDVASISTFNAKLGEREELKKDFDVESTAATSAKLKENS